MARHKMVVVRVQDCGNGTHNSRLPSRGWGTHHVGLGSHSGGLTKPSFSSNYSRPKSHRSNIGTEIKLCTGKKQITTLLDIKRTKNV